MVVDNVMPTILTQIVQFAKGVRSSSHRFREHATRASSASVEHAFHVVTITGCGSPPSRETPPHQLVRSLLGEAPAG